MADVFIELLLTHMAANENLRLGTSHNYTMIFHVEDIDYLKVGISRNFPEFCRIDSFSFIQFFEKKFATYVCISTVL